MVTGLACLADQHWIGIGERVIPWTETPSADRIRLGVRDEGVYRVTEEDIVQASGWDASSVRRMMLSYGLSLTCQGKPVAWTPAGSALFFYGLPVSELFAPENVYWLSFSDGVTMGTVADGTPDPSDPTNDWFMCETHYRSSFLTLNDSRDRRSTQGTLTNVLNFGEWVPSSADESTRVQSRLLSLPGYCPTEATGTTVRAELVSYYDFSTPDTHCCEILVNGVSCGAYVWSNEQAVAFSCSVPAGALTNETAWLSVRNAGGTTSLSDFMILDVIVQYPRRCTATNDMLLCAGGTAPVLSVQGFANDAVAVWDVTAPRAPARVSVTPESETTGEWRVTFPCGGYDRRYAVFSTESGAYAPSVSGVRDVAWSDPQEMPELAIVIPPRRWASGFEDAVQSLADFREAQGVRTRVIDAEALYNAFTDGIVHPEAFRRFCAAGVTNASGQTLHYVLFAGYGGSDYKLDAFPLEKHSSFTSFFPLYLLPQTEVSSATSGALMLPNDTVLGDVTGDGIPEVAIGRFVATNADDAASMAAKSIRYELTETWKKKAIFTADWQNVGSLYGNFPGIAAATDSGFPGVGWTLATFYPSASQSDLTSFWINTYYQTGVYYELREGAGFFYYVGHSNDLLVGHLWDERLCDASMISSGTWSFAPVAMLMGCRLGRWTTLDLKSFQQCVAEAGVHNRTSGFTAALSASGYMDTADAMAFSYGFRDAVAAGALRLGDAWRSAFAALGSETASGLAHLTLLGDPSLCIRVDRTARGTSTDWLIEEGLTDDPYADLKDQDGDGFATWLEVQSGTPYNEAVLRVRSLTLPSSAVLNATASVTVQDADAPAAVLTFETSSGFSYHILAADDLTAGNWESVPWRPVGGAEWLSSAISGDEPLKQVEIPYQTGTGYRFYKVVSE